ncbi:lysine N(6)-hydroxylase/L-ornithine N(5)-oxygenase family protein [Saccharothrix longispora]|uniref:lysine N(6)-hydroxylase/L-ornithine N(5)-oxygenase family protein n=1 Tax=Saccharothrix longispora TaxID=33920 RepID=UPI0028FD384F|nr:SidA/IucD/PvdA family monooxygenase [Saccharothrix longispora]MDU0288079.1 SidA/IucD/PvdA family monooxygenase [Saccharothrix longispora]
MIDVLAIGCGPFNLGLAALASTVDDVDVVVLEARPELRWHSGMMFDDAVLQVSFLADLVTLVAPTHPLSFLEYLRDADRLYPFYVRERFHPTRREYEDYLRWAASRLPVRFSHPVTSVRWEDDRFAVAGDGFSCEARNLVLGVGTEPFVPPALDGLGDRLVHTSGYLHRDVDAARVTVVGSGQSGAEVVLDLLRRNASPGGPAVSWLTRTPVFAPLDYTKLVLEMTTPAYVRHFHSLPQERRDAVRAEQWRHYRAISSETIEELHDLLYRREWEHGLAPVELRPGVAVVSSRVTASGVELTCAHRDTGRTFTHVTDLVVAATGYRQAATPFLAPLEPLVRRDDAGRYVVALDHSVALDPTVTGRVFVANADLHSHGVAAPDLGIGAVRNATILNAVTGREVYPLPKHTAYTSFTAPGDDRD